MSLSAPMLCCTGCGLPVYRDHGQCLAHLANDAPGHPWLPCAGCRRALDRLLGPLAEPEDELCDVCAISVAIVGREAPRAMSPGYSQAETLRALCLANIGLAETVDV